MGTGGGLFGEDVQVRKESLTPSNFHVAMRIHSCAALESQKRQAGPGVGEEQERAEGSFVGMAREAAQEPGTGLESQRGRPQR